MLTLDVLVMLYIMAKVCLCSCFLFPEMMMLKNNIDSNQKVQPASLAKKMNPTTVVTALLLKHVPTVNHPKTHVVKRRPATRKM